MVAAVGLPRTGAAADSIRLCVLVIAEQFRSDYLERFESLLGQEGLRRLMNQGAYFPDCRMAASSFSSSGIATIATGAWPSAHGIVADSWFDVETGEAVTAQPAKLQAPTLASSLLAAPGKPRVATTSLRRGPAEIWAGDSVSGDLQKSIYEFQPSPGYAYAPPDWLRAFREANAAEKWKNAQWEPLRTYAGAPPLRTLVDVPDRPGEFQALFEASPFAQAAQFDLLRTLLAEEKLSESEGPALVTVILSPMSLLGHDVGAESPLMREMVLHFDRQIELTLEALDKSPGRGGYSLVFTAAHGAPEAPPPGQRHGLALDSENVARTINQALSDFYDVSPVKNRYVERYVYPFLYLRHSQLNRYGIDPRQARRKAAEAALQVPGVAAWYTADGECSRAGAWKNRMADSFHMSRCGDLMLSYVPGAVEDFAGGRGVSYGSLYSYDTRVPLIFYGPRFRNAVIEAAVESIDIAPTLARAFRVAPPAASLGRVLSRALRSEDTSTAKQPPRRTGR